MIEYFEKYPTQDIILKKLLPILFDALKSNDKEFENGSFMILTQICSKVKLSENILKKIIEKVINKLNQFDFENEILLLIFIYQSQKFYLIENSLFEKMINLPLFIDQILIFEKKYCLKNFLRMVLYQIVNNILTSNNFDEKYEIIFQKITFKDYIPSLIFFIFKHYLENNNTEIIQKLLIYIERKYPTETDKGLNMCYSNITDKNDQSKLLGFIQTTFKGNLFFKKGTNYEYLSETNMTLYLSLEHPESKIRILALEKLEKNYQNNPKEILEFSKKIITSKLLIEDDEFVLKKILNFKNLYTIIDNDDIHQIIHKLYLKRN
jgi:U3 small nucleolar RNA-associated protein 10